MTRRGDTPVALDLSLGKAAWSRGQEAAFEFAAAGKICKTATMFGSIRSFLEKRRIRRDVETFMNPDEVGKVLKAGGPTPSFTPGRIEYVGVFIEGHDPALVFSRIAKVAGTAMEHGAVVTGVMGGLVVAAFGVPPSPDPKPGARANLISTLHAQLPACLKIVHGAANGHHGLFGGGATFSYTFLVPEFDAILGSLSRMEFGQTEEFVGR